MAEPVVVRKGQIWADKNQWSAGRTVRVVEIDGTHAVLEVVTMPHKQGPFSTYTIGRRTRVQIGPRGLREYHLVSDPSLEQPSETNETLDDVLDRAERTLSACRANFNRASVTAVERLVADMRKMAAELQALDDEVAELAQERAEHFANATMLRGLNVRDGQVHLELAHAHEFILIWCGAMRAVLDDRGTENYAEVPVSFPRQASVSMDLRDGQHPTDDYVLTLQRRRGKTPHELRMAAERRASELAAANATLTAQLANLQPQH